MEYSVIRTLFGVGAPLEKHKNKTEGMQMLNEETKRIREKQKLVKDLCKDKEKKLELCEQIAICEELARPITEKMIRELVVLPLRQMQNTIRNYKLI